MSGTWFITGASSGLGAEMARQLLQEGERVIGTSRHLDALKNFTEQYPDSFFAVALDLTDPDGIARAVSGAFSQHARIDVMISNAGYGLFGAAEELEAAAIDRQIATNLTGSIHLIRAALPHLRQQGGGRIVQVSSEGGQIAYPSFSVYHATKWGVEGFLEAVAQEVAPVGIACIIAEPGPTGTNFGTNLTVAEPMAAYADTPAGAIRRAIADGSFVLKGDAVRTASLIIDAAKRESPPLRLALGSTAYNSISSALKNRLALLETQRDTAMLADRTDL